MQETQVQSLVWEDPLEKGMATHSGIPPGEFHGQKSLTGYSPGESQRVGYDKVTNTFTFTQTVCFKSDQSHFQCSLANVTGGYCIIQFSSQFSLVQSLGHVRLFTSA